VAVDAVEEFGRFVLEYLGGQAAEEPGTYHCNVFMCRGRFENNLAQWTMRICDFLVDRLGWSFLVCSLCNTGEMGERRTQQMLLRYDGDKREVPVASTLQQPDLSEAPEVEFPAHWQAEVVSGEVPQRTVKCGQEEHQALQQLCDVSFRRVLTRDRLPDDDAPDDEEMPYRLEVVQAFRSEHFLLHRRFEEHRAGREPDELFSVKTQEASAALVAAQQPDAQLQPGSSYFFHGTNPSSAMSILKTGFVLQHAGSATGTMFGAGVYMAECSSKSDEYGCDDGGNTFPGLMALLVCRCFVGVPLVVQQAGDHVSQAGEAGYDCVCGDRESAVGTYREFVFFDERQIYPEYAVIYRRQYNKNKVPAHMVRPSRGTTGRFWQIRRRERGWRNAPSEVSKELSRAAKAGETTVTVSHGTVQYTFDLAESQGYGVVTEGDRQGTRFNLQLRPPMHKQA